MDDGFVKAYSDNLPEVTFEMVCAFTSSHKDYINVEVKHGKTKRYVCILNTMNHYNQTFYLFIGQRESPMEIMLWAMFN